MTTMAAEEEATEPSAARGRIRTIVAYLGACVWGGIVAGLLIGGVGSRLAMFVLRVTSDDFVVGLESDDGFTIGQFSTDTFFLVILAGAVGVAASLLYGAVRVWIPRPYRALSFGLLGGLVGGSAIVHEEGIDFFVLEPQWLAIAMFVALPTFGAVALSLVTERVMERRGSGGPVGWAWLLAPLPALVLTGPIGIALIVALAIGVALDPKVPFVRWWQTAPLTWLGRCALLLWAAVGAVALVNDIQGIAGLPA